MLPENVIFKLSYRSQEKVAEISAKIVCFMFVKFQLQKEFESESVNYDR